MIFSLFGKKRKEKEAQQKATARLKAKQTFEDRMQQAADFRKDRIFDKFEWHYVDEVQPLTYHTKRTFEVLADAKVIESDFFLVKDKQFVCFADQTRSKEFKDYIIDNKAIITEILSQKHWNFVHRPSTIDDFESLNLSYYFPLQPGISMW